MPRMRIAIDYQQCQPDTCQGGRCQAALACDRGVLTQTAPRELPDTRESACLACGDCLSPCPLQAVRLL